LVNAWDVVPENCHDPYSVRRWYPDGQVSVNVPVVLVVGPEIVAA
jgi:hypothetical protein